MSDNNVADDGDATPKTSGNTRRQIAVQKASQLAQEVQQDKKVETPSDFVKYTKEAIVFQINKLKAELRVLEGLFQLSDQQKLETLFCLMDTDKDGTVSAGELADGLRKIKGELSFDDGIKLAIAKVATYDKDHDGKLNPSEFKDLMLDLSDSLGCTSFHEMSQVLVMALMFSETGNTQQENELVHEMGTQIDSQVIHKEKMEVNKKAKRLKARLRAIFDIFDVDGDGRVDFKEVVLGMYKITDTVEDTSNAAVQALLYLDNQSSCERRSMDLKQFSTFLLGVSKTVPGLTVDDICDEITKFAAEDEVGISSIGKRFSLLGEQEETLDLLTQASQEEVDALKGVNMGRLNKLFDLFDLDGDGTIDFHELALGLKKFRDVTNMEKTVDESVKVLNDFDTDNDQKLDRHEFALFVTRFSEASDSKLDEMIDFMIVMSALRENSTDAEEYIKSLSVPDKYTYDWGE